jgi:hyperosmotically inducible protein
VAVMDGTVTLTGTADSAWERDRAEELALDHRDVVNVNDEISIVSDRSDTSIADDVSRKLRNYVHYSIFDNVSLRVKEGVVTLMGDVTWGYKAKDMAKMASRVPGVRAVKNEIETLPASANDQQLRQELASRIYGDSTFFNYSIQPVPPVHIVVDNGRVTLTGVVDTRIQKRRAEQIARETFGVLSVDNELRLAGSGAES